eukprot:366296-Chlamydomonas_euryale.AAC.5
MVVTCLDRWTFDVRGLCRMRAWTSTPGAGADAMVVTYIGLVDALERTPKQSWAKLAKSMMHTTLRLHMCVCVVHTCSHASTPPHFPPPC